MKLDWKHITTELSRSGGYGDAVIASCRNSSMIDKNYYICAEIRSDDIDVYVSKAGYVYCSSIQEAQQIAEEWVEQLKNIPPVRH